jgi:CubicO group peptidase (beta-lactamase class C family)
MLIDGYVATEFEPVLDAFARNFEERSEVGAAVSVYIDGQPVVDLWGGLADPTHGAGWQEDTLVLVYSATKGVTAICANRLIERGLLDPDAPVATLWPEFAANGKDAITVAQVMSHQAGLPYVEGEFTLEESLSWTPMVAALAAQAPIWEPGTKHGYHMRTFGWLVGELIRRADPQHRTVGSFWREEIAEGLGVDFWIGLPEALESRVAQLVPPRTDLREALRAFGDELLLARVFSNPGGHFNYDDMWNTRQLHAAELPSSNGIGNARGLARLYASCIGVVDGVRTLGATTIGRATLERACGKDEVLMTESCFGLGFMLGRAFGAANPPDAFGHAGAGGSLAFADPGRGLAFAYVMNDLRFDPAGDPRSEELVRAVYRALESGSRSKGSVRSTRGSSASPSTRSPTMLRWISSVPPRMEIDGAVRNKVCHSPCGSSVASGPRMRIASAAYALNRAAPRTFMPEPSGPGRPARAVSRARRAVYAITRVSMSSCASASRMVGSAVRPRARASSTSRPTSSNPLVPPAVEAPRSYDRHVSATRHPSPTSPMRSASGTRASSRNTSVKCASPFICRRGRTSTPGPCRSSAKAVIPRCFRTEVSWRASNSP